MLTWVYCTLELERLHRWKEAKKIPEVAYLSYLHRHLFQIRVDVQVFSDNREIEFHMLKHRVQKYVNEQPEVIGSCEMLAKDIVTFLEKAYGSGRKFRVQVSEDGECGASVET